MWVCILKLGFMPLRGKSPWQEWGCPHSLETRPLRLHSLMVRCTNRGWIYLPAGALEETPRQKQRQQQTCAQALAMRQESRVSLVTFIATWQESVCSECTELGRSPADSRRARAAGVPRITLPGRQCPSRGSSFSVGEPLWVQAGKGWRKQQLEGTKAPTSFLFSMEWRNLLTHDLPHRRFWRSREHGLGLKAALIPSDRA